MGVWLALAGGAVYVGVCVGLWLALRPTSGGER